MSYVLWYLHSPVFVQVDVSVMAMSEYGDMLHTCKLWYFIAVQSCTVDCLLWWVAHDKAPTILVQTRIVHLPIPPVSGILANTMYLSLCVCVCVCVVCCVCVCVLCVCVCVCVFVSRHQERTSSVIGQKENHQRDQRRCKRRDWYT